MSLLLLEVSLRRHPPRRALHGHKCRANRMLSAPLNRCLCVRVCVSVCVCERVSVAHASGVHNLAAIALILIKH